MTDHFVIEKNVPSPVKAGRVPEFQVLADMQVGDSFSLPPEMAPKVKSAVSYQQKRHPMRRFSVRMEGDHYRCWRTA